MNTGPSLKTLVCLWIALLLCRRCVIAYKPNKEKYTTTITFHQGITGSVQNMHDYIERMMSQ